MSWWESFCNWFLDDKKKVKDMLKNPESFNNTASKKDEKPTKTRGNFLIGFIGTNRTGKSSIARMVADAWKRSRDELDAKLGRKKSYTIISFDPQGRFKDISDYLIRPDDKKWARKLLKFRNALVILDDYKIINQINVPVDGFADLLYYRAAYNIDIMYICHNPALVLNTLTYFTTHYYIFYTQATEGRFSDKIPTYQQCMRASKMVNKYVSMHGRGAHPKSPEYTGQSFPYMVVDNEGEVPKAFNMDKKLY